jgi:hypothetical protein
MAKLPQKGQGQPSSSMRGMGFGAHQRGTLSMTQRRPHANRTGGGGCRASAGSWAGRGSGRARAVDEAAVVRGLSFAGVVGIAATVSAPWEPKKRDWLPDIVGKPNCGGHVSGYAESGRPLRLGERRGAGPIASRGSGMRNRTSKSLLRRRPRDEPLDPRDTSCARRPGHEKTRPGTLPQ